MACSDGKEKSSFWSSLCFKMLNEQQVRQIDAALASLGEYGEVHLILKHGQLKYINRVESHKAWGARTNEGDE